MPKPSLFDHPKFKRLVRRLALPAPYVLGHLEYLWRVGCSTGNPVIGDDLDIELAAEWQGESGVLAAALVEERFVDRRLEDGRLEIHDLFENAPEYVARRADREAQRRLDRVCQHCHGDFRSADPRARFCSSACRTGHWRKQQADRDGSDETVTDANVTQRNRDTPVTSPGRHVTHRDGSTGTAQTGTTQHGTKSVSSATPDGVTQPDSAVLLSFPTVGQGQATWALTRQRVDHWRTLYPDLDVLAAARKALAWIEAKPSRRKTARGMDAFLVNWLNRETDDRGRAAATHDAGGYRPASPPRAAVDWHAECRERHGGRCSNAHFHAAQLRAEERAS